MRWGPAALAGTALLAMLGWRIVPAQAPEPAGTRTAPNPVPLDPPAVRTYVAPRADVPPRIDGTLDDVAWQAARWSARFVDIEGSRRPDPPLATRFKLLWDEERLYICAQLEEPDLWATLSQRDTIIFLDNDFEVFLDPDGDTHHYVELEINALATVWDLWLDRPYRDGGHARTAWDIDALASAVRLDGTLNDPSDRDRGWSLELAIPWAALDRTAPRDGEQWRVNFSRVQWSLDTAAGGYHKRVATETGRPLAEANWVWSPQHAVNMHLPELWGVVEFRASERADSSVTLTDERQRWSLRRIYYAQRAHQQRTGRYAARLADLALAGLPPATTIVVRPADYRASVPAATHGVWHIRADGRLWKEP